MTTGLEGAAPVRSTAMTVDVASGTTVLHALRVKGFAETDVLAEVTRLDDVTTVRALEDFAADGLVKRRDGRHAGWSLTPEGRAEHGRRLADELDAAGARAEVEAGYAGFTRLNQAVLVVCTDWDLRDGAVNDHRDRAYDREVIDRLAGLHAEAEPVLDGLAAALPRFAGYRDRLAAALAKVQAGDRDWFDKPLIDSYHSVWFELHEDLLATLGRQRSAETGGAA
jgi:DNA-binding MarR family transcriptional regulator